MSEKKKFYEGTPEELEYAFFKSDDYEYTEKNFNIAKNWLGIRLHFGAVTKEQYDEELERLKKEYGIK